MIALSNVIKDKKINIETEKSSGKSSSKKNEDDDESNPTPEKAMDQIEKGIDDFSKYSLCFLRSTRQKRSLFP